MPLIVIGGHTRSVGKTSVVAGLIAALPQYHWTAFKITQYGHGVCSANGEACDCATDDHSWAISEERSASGDSDTARFLAAGAVRVWWVRTQQGRLAEAMPAIRQKFSGNVIVESNSILKFIRPDLYLTVLDPATADFKNSAQEFLDRADAIILHRPKQNSSEVRDQESIPAWERVSLKPAENKPQFYITPPDYVTAEIVAFVRGKLELLQAEARSQ